jgi:hypothetical protein
MFECSSMQLNEADLREILYFYEILSMKKVLLLCNGRIYYNNDDLSCGTVLSFSQFKLVINHFRKLKP